MALGAISLRTGITAPKTENNSQVNFGKKHDHDGHKKSHTAAYVAVGTVAALAIAALAFRKKIIGSKMGKSLVDNAEKLKDKTVETAKDLGEKTKKVSKKALKKANEVRIKAKNVLTGNFLNKQEKEILSTYRKSGKNKDGVYEVLRKYGLTEEQEKTVRGLNAHLKASFAQKKLTAKPVSERFIISQSLKEATPKDIVKSIVATTENLIKNNPVK